MTLAQALANACVEQHDLEVIEYARVSRGQAAAEQARNEMDTRGKAAIAEYPIIADLLRVDPYDETTWPVVEHLSRAEIVSMKSLLPRWFYYKDWGSYSEIVGGILITREHIARAKAIARQ